MINSKNVKAYNPKNNCSNTKMKDMEIYIHSHSGRLVLCDGGDNGLVTLYSERLKEDAEPDRSMTFHWNDWEYRRVGKL